MAMSLRTSVLTRLFGTGLLALVACLVALVFINGKVADSYGIQWAFLITALCELYVLFYALWGSKPTHAVAPVRLTEEGS